MDVDHFGVVHPFRGRISLDGSINLVVLENLREAWQTRLVGDSHHDSYCKLCDYGNIGLGTNQRSCNVFIKTKEEVIFCLFFP